MLGSASATTVESSIRMKSPAQAPASVHQRRFRSSIGSTLRRGRRRDRGRGRSPSGRRPRPDRRSRAQRSGRSSPSCAGLAPFSAMQPVLSPIARISATSASERRCSAAAPPAGPASPRSGSAAGPVSWIRVGTTHSTAGWARFHWQASWIGVSSVALGDRDHPLELLQAGLDPAVGAERAVIALGQLHPGLDVAPEEAAVVDDPGDHPDVVAGRGLEAELAGPGLERVEDDHRPVDPLAEALEAGDQVEGEPVRRARGDADLRGQARLAQRLHPVPDRLAGVADPVRVVEEEKVERGGAEPPEAASRPPSAGTRRRRRARAAPGR